jgi:hypothetical protein
MDIAMTFAAAGATPASFVFQLTQPHANVTLPSTPGEWTLYGWLPRLFEYTAMKQCTVTAQTRLLVVRALRKNLVDPLTEPLRKEVAAMKKSDAMDAQKARDADLQWKAAAMELFARFDPATAPESRPISVEAAAAVAQRLLAHVPGVGETNMTRLFVRTLKMIYKRDEFDAEDWAYVRDYTAQVHNKRSGCFREIKQEAIRSKDPKAVLEAGVRKVASTLKIDPSKVAVQNRKSFELQEDAINEEARMRMKGDGEVARAPWCSRKALDIDDELTCKQLLPGLLGDVVAVQKEEQMQVTIPEEMTGALAVLTELKSKRKQPALQLAKQLPSITAIEVLERSQLPMGPFVSLLLSAGCSASNMRDMLAAILEVLLVNWQDVVASEQKAVAIFAEF